MSQTPHQTNRPATWAEYHDTRTYHSRGRTRIRATEKPRSVKATARTYRREMRRVAGGQPLPCADPQHSKYLRSPGLVSPSFVPAYGAGVVCFSGASCRRTASADFSRTPEWLAW